MAISRQLETPSLEVGIISGQRAALLGVAFAFSETITAEFSDSQISLFKGGSVHVDQDPTGRQYLNQAYPAHYQSVRSPAVNYSQNQFDTSNMPNLGVIYLASQDGKNMVQVFTEPKNMEFLRNLIGREINNYATTGAAGMA